MSAFEREEIEKRISYFKKMQKAEEWLDRLKQLLNSTKDVEHVKEHIELLEWLIKNTKENLGEGDLKEDTKVRVLE